MRITNKIIQNNSLTNINTNKTLQDKLSNMISSEKKINRPSDDPIIALRSLRLRTSVNQTDQFLNKNVEDAKSWLTVTEDSIDTLSEIISDIRKQYTKGANDPLMESDREIILENLESLAAEVYNTGNADFAGRSVFTGYRTDTTLTFQKDEDVQFNILETKDSLTVDTVRFVHRDESDETKVTDNTIARIRISYDKADNIEFKSSADEPDPTKAFKFTMTTADGNRISSYDTSDGATLVTVKTISSSVKTDEGAVPPVYSAQDYVLHNPGEAVFVPETGELLLGKEIMGAGTELDPENVEDVTVSYAKTKWDKGDLRPQHYFTCCDVSDPSDVIEYNYNSSPEGEICYNIGVNQSLRINTTASECFTHNISRDIDDVMRAIREAKDIDEEIKSLEAERDALPKNDTAGRDAVQAKIDAAKKAQTFISDELHNLFSKGISKADQYLDANNLALTSCGTRSKRLDLIENRLDTQLDTLKELKSDNEDADMAETAIRLSSAKYAYDASLMATSKAIQQSLLNYL